MRLASIKNLSRPLRQPLSVRYCERFLCKLRGLMFQTNLAPHEGLLLVETKASRWNTGIHMLGMFFDLSIIWLDGDLKVVDKGMARRWRSFLFPRNPARYVIECVVSRYEEFQLGDQLAFEKTE
ncbi:MAG: DUF192 domain-containing protein [Chloroflexi bacterium]|nr:DUF192 domain-containing protein [Chloroflexota bacterium]